MTIIDLQRRLVEVGRIRMGATLPTAKGGTRPVKLDYWRLTSRDESRMNAAAALFGGKVEPWGDRPGEFELLTESYELPIMLLPGQAISQFYETWSGGGCKRRCDGVNELLTDGPCLCDPEARECKPHTRLSVLLPDVPGLGCWRLDTSGYYAAVELTATVEFLESATARGMLLPARLRIDQRSVLRDGQTMRFAVPVVDVDIRMLDVAKISASPAALPVSTEAGIPSGYKPLVRNGGVGVDEALTALEQQREPTARTARSAAPLAAVGDEDAFSDEPLSVETGDVVASAAGAEEISDAQKRKLNVLVGQLRDAGHITTEQLYRAVGFHPIPDESGELHWSPLRDGLSKSQATDLIGRLSALEARVLV